MARQKKLDEELLEETRRVEEERIRLAEEEARREIEAIETTQVNITQTVQYLFTY